MGVTTASAGATAMGTAAVTTGVAAEASTTTEPVRSITVEATSARRQAGLARFSPVRDPEEPPDRRHIELVRHRQLTPLAQQPSVAGGRRGACKSVR
jgi:hypothetical protein